MLTFSLAGDGTIKVTEALLQFSQQAKADLPRTGLAMDVILIEGVDLLAYSAR